MFWKKGNSRKFVSKNKQRESNKHKLKERQRVKITLHSKVVITTNQQLTRPAQPEKKRKEVSKCSCAMEETKEEIQRQRPGEVSNRKFRDLDPTHLPTRPMATL